MDVDAPARSSARLAETDLFRRFQYLTVPLKPVRGPQLESLLNDEEHPDNTELLARLAERTGLILDAPGQASA